MLRWTGLFLLALPACADVSLDRLRVEEYLPLEARRRWYFKDAQGRECGLRLRTPRDFVGRSCHRLRATNFFTEGSGTLFIAPVGNNLRVFGYGVAYGRFHFSRPFDLLRGVPRSGDSWDVVSTLGTAQGGLQQPFSLEATVGRSEMRTVLDRRVRVWPVKYRIRFQGEERIRTLWFARRIGPVEMTAHNGMARQTFRLYQMEGGTR